MAATSSSAAALQISQSGHCGPEARGLLRLTVTPAPGPGREARPRGSMRPRPTAPAPGTGPGVTRSEVEANGSEVWKMLGSAKGGQGVDAFVIRFMVRTYVFSMVSVSCNFL